MIRRGATGAAVAEVRARLAHLGYVDYPASVAEAGSFDDDLDRAVRAFQQERGLSVDGIVGPDTYRRLDQARW
ncbi:MAG: peptidoglycan-binding domain-containing protein [Actinomycetales bacterium]